MGSTYMPKHFSIEELVPPPEFMPKELRAEYEKRPDALFRLFDQRLLVTLDRLRERYGSCSINNWHLFDAAGWGDTSVPMFRFSGWRPVACDEGAALSEHKFFRAMDCKFRHVRPSEIWDEMLERVGAPEFEFMQRIEAFGTMTWFHFDLGQHARYGKAVKVIAHKGNRAGLPAYIERVA